MTFIEKPLGIKAYGSIPHLPGSRVGPGDHTITPGQARICTQSVPGRRDTVWVTEKLDGSNVAVARLSGYIVPLIRAGYPAVSSHYEQHRIFAQWAYDNADRFLSVLVEGERLVGEWLAQAHGTRYQLSHYPFVAFDLMRGYERILYEDFCRRVGGEFVIPRLIHRGPISIEEVVSRLEPSGHGAIDPVEGAVWRVENGGRVSFLAKFVRPGKRDGIYLPEISGKEAIWNWRPTW